jgi:hypothetical protein
VQLADLVGLNTTAAGIYAKTLVEVLVVAQHLRISQREVTNDLFKLNTAFALVSEQVGILDLSGCYQIEGFSGLEQLVTLPSLDLAGNGIKATGAIKARNCVVLVILVKLFTYAGTDEI